MDVSKLEPADRDPRKLRNTALCLVGIIIVGAVVILWAYSYFGKRTLQSDRPTLQFKITEEVTVMTADGQIRDIQDLKGHISLALILTTESLAQSEPSLAALREIMTHYEGREDRPRLLAFVIDGDESDPAAMKDVLSEYGGEPEVWRVVTGKDGKVSIRAFLKNRLRYGIYPEKRNGEFVYDSKIILLDQHLHVRGIPGSKEGWDFERVAEMEAEFERAQKEHPDKELIPPPMTTKRLRELLRESIDYLYANPDEKAQG